MSSIFISSNKLSLKLKDELELSFEEEELEKTICEDEKNKNFESGWNFFYIPQNLKSSQKLIFLPKIL